LPIHAFPAPLFVAAMLPFEVLKNLFDSCIFHVMAISQPWHCRLSCYVNHRTYTVIAMHQNRCLDPDGE